MIEAYARMLRNYMVFGGRTTRSDFWSFVLVHSMITLVTLILSGTLHDAFGILLALYLLATLMPTAAGAVRRLHDTGRGFWWLPVGVGLPAVASAMVAIGFQLSGVGFALGLFTAIIHGEHEAVREGERLFLLGAWLIVFSALAAVVGGILAIALLVLLAAPGNTGKNKYGPQPKSS